MVTYLSILSVDVEFACGGILFSLLKLFLFVCFHVESS